jgi:ABC-2 type transport system permease protein
MNRQFLAFLRLELAEALRSKWAAFSCVLYLCMGVAFVWLGLRESSVLGFTGLSRVLLNLTSAVIVVCPLLVLIGTHAAIVRARANGFCELLLVQPVRRSTWFFALLGARLLILVGPLLILLVAAAVGGLFLEGDAGILRIAAKSAGICAALIFAFIGAGLWLSARAQTTERALVWALCAFVVTSALHDVLLIAMLLRTPLPPQAVFALAALNPSEAARVGILASVDPELSALGPVGFWLANYLGSDYAAALAITWPLALGVLASWRALRRTQRLDLVV